MNLALCKRRNQLSWNPMMRSYSQVVFTEPSESFLACVQNHPPVTFPRLPAGFTLPPPVTQDESKRKIGDSKDHPLSHWFLNFSETDELLQLAAARQQVQTHIAKIRRQISLTDGQNQPFKPL
ncbi:Transcription initiation factor TFIID subunit 14b [Hibiscus syriacus]|uniref:Transcription initiation factor TFIID subunit 14b n=1 Tax=Hibiscus syriacus TaxID=106335 RepID=A0A6A3AU56_HIBSY|nr:Transcription initiation factor TFIID subunit 14b [Hibiscus syriacus]